MAFSWGATCGPRREPRLPESRHRHSHSTFHFAGRERHGQVNALVCSREKSIICNLLRFAACMNEKDECILYTVPSITVGPNIIGILPIVVFPLVRLCIWLSNALSDQHSLDPLSRIGKEYRRATWEGPTALSAFFLRFGRSYIVSLSTKERGAR